MKTELKYRTFQELLDEVSLDLRTYSNEGMIEPAQLIKIAQKVNYDLGLRINQTKCDILEIHNGKAQLPDNFYVLNYAMLCSKYKLIQEIPSGRHTEDVQVDLSKFPGGSCNRCFKPNICADEFPVPDSCNKNYCDCKKIYTNSCGETFTVIQQLGGHVIRTYDEFEYLTFKPGRFVDRRCHNNRISSRHEAEIKDGFIFTNLNHGKLFISYEANLEDDDGNLLVLDHPMINEYYEYTLKQRILENLYFNGEDVVQKMQLVEQRLRPARNNALSIVNTPDFQELQDIHNSNRRYMYNKYYRMFL